MDFSPYYAGVFMDSSPWLRAKSRFFVGNANGAARLPERVAVVAAAGKIVVSMLVPGQKACCQALIAAIQRWLPVRLMWGLTKVL